MRIRSHAIYYKSLGNDYDELRPNSYTKYIFESGKSQAAPESSAGTM